MVILPKTVYRFNANLAKIPMTSLTEAGKTILRLTWKHKRPLIDKAI
jgi:hypothetical protein